MPNNKNLPPLRIALRNGAEIGYAKALISSNPPQSIAHFVEQRLSTLDDADLTYIQKLAKSILAAAAIVGNVPSNEPIDPDEIPTNADLFGDDWEGKRLQWFGEWRVPGTDKWYSFAGSLPDLTSLSDIYQYAHNLALDYVEGSPGKFIPAGQETIDYVDVRILGIEKAY